MTDDVFMSDASDQAIIVAELSTQNVPNQPGAAWEAQL